MKRIGWFVVLLLAMTLMVPVAFATGVEEAETEELYVLMTPQEEWCQGKNGVRG